MFVVTQYDHLVNLDQYAGVQIQYHIDGRHVIYAVSYEFSNTELASWKETDEGAKKAEFVYQEIINALDKGQNLLDLRQYF